MKTAARARRESLRQWSARQHRGFEVQTMDYQVEGTRCAIVVRYQPPVGQRRQEAVMFDPAKWLEQGGWRAIAAGQLRMLRRRIRWKLPL